MSIAQAGVLAIAIVCGVTLVAGAFGLQAVQDHERLLRRRPQRQRRLERLGDRRRVPLRRVVPRHRRPRLRARRRHALVPRRLHRRLRRAPGPRRRSAAAIGRLHAPRLRRGSPRVAPCARAGVAARHRHRLALPAPAVPGRRDRPEHRHRRAPRSRQSHRGRGRAGQRDGGRYAVDHPGAGHAVLAEAHRDLDPGLRPARPLVAERGGRPERGPHRGCRLGAGAQRLRRPRASRLRHVLDDPRPVLRHHGAAARAGPLLHQPRRTRGPSHHARRGRPARALLPVHTGLRRARSRLPPDPARRRPRGLRDIAVALGHRCRASSAPSCRRCWPAGRSPRSCRPPPV